MILLVSKPRNMERNHFMMVSAALAFIVACVALFAPGPAVHLVGLHMDMAGALFARGMGGAILGMAVGLWMARNDGPSASLRALLVMWGIFHAIGLVITCMAMSAGVFNLAIASVALGLRSLFVIGSVYYVVKMKGSSA